MCIQWYPVNSGLSSALRVVPSRQAMGQSPGKLPGSVQLQRGEAKPKGCTEAPKGGSVNFALDALRAQVCEAMEISMEAMDSMDSMDLIDSRNSDRFDYGKIHKGREEDLRGCTCSCPVITKARSFLFAEDHSKARPFPERSRSRL